MSWFEVERDTADDEDEPHAIRAQFTIGGTWTGREWVLDEPAVLHRDGDPTCNDPAHLGSLTERRACELARDMAFGVDTVDRLKTAAAFERAIQGRI